MSKSVYRSAMGKAIDMDSIRLSNEHTIAIGNMKVNARGDELGPGGKIVKTRNQVMDEYYKLNTPQVTDSSPQLEDDPIPAKKVLTPSIGDPAPQPENTELRGSLASSIAKK